MARITRSRRHLRPTSDGGAADRLSALPDDMLRLILRRLDSRTALTTAVLARGWARLPRDLPALALTVSDVLPRRYHRCLELRKRPAAAVRELDAVIARCERRAMRAFADGVSGLLLRGADDDGRRAESLRLEFFPTEESARVDDLIAAAVGAWGVEDLEVVVRPPLLNLFDGPAYAFPDHRLGDRSRLRRLTLANCTVPPLCRYGALTELVLRNLPASTPVSTYEALFAAAHSPLQALRLESCGCAADQPLAVSAPPDSRLAELVVDGCLFPRIELRAAPALERLACLTNSVELWFGDVPRLGHVALAFSRKSDAGHCELACFLEDAPPTVAGLVVRLAGPRRWIGARPMRTRLLGLTRLLVADLPASWDVTWTRVLLAAAPALEVLHIHVVAARSEQPETEPPPPGDNEPGRADVDEINWQPLVQAPARFRHRRLREVAVAGFGRTWRQIFFVRYLARVCKKLQRVLLLKDWCVEEKGLWDWELVQQQECPWSEQEKMVVARQVKYGRYWCRPQLQVVVR